MYLVRFLYAINGLLILPLALNWVWSEVVSTAWYSAGFNQNPNTHDQAHAALQSVCHIHYRLYEAEPMKGPETLFEVLGLNESSPLLSDPTWLEPGTPENRLVQERVRQEWNKRITRILETQQQIITSVEHDQLYDEMERVSLVADALLNHKKAGVIMSVVMPQIAHLKGKARLKALKKLCGQHWKAI